MKIEYTNVNTNKLHDELMISGVMPTLVESLDDKTWITFADGTDMELVQQIIEAHDSTPLSIPLTEIELLQKENLLLKAQVQANADISDFHEELIVELAMMVYQ